MLKNIQQKLIYLTLWFLNFCNVIWAAPQSGPTLDLGIYKVSIDTSNGLAVRRDINIDLPFLKVKKTTEFGFGDPMVGNNDDDDSDSEENRKRRKRRDLSEVTPEENLVDSTHMRQKREPCRYQMRPAQPGGGGTNGGDGDDGGDGGDDGGDVEGRRRRRAMTKRNAARKNKSQSKKRQKGRRRRRQVEAEFFNDEIQNQKNGSKISQGLNNALEKVNNAWKSFLQITDQLIKDVKQTINSFRSGQKLSPENFEPTNEAEYI